MCKLMQISKDLFSAVADGISFLSVSLFIATLVIADFQLHIDVADYIEQETKRRITGSKDKQATNPVNK